jgi:DTW domain-containing protein YfiP
MHHRERYLTSNTANLTTLVLENSKICLRGLPEKPFEIDDLELMDNEKPLFLFPHEDALELTPESVAKLKQAFPQKKFHLIVPDGTWSQAVKCYRREKGLIDIQCVKLPPGEPGRYRLRKSSDENRLSTYEAIARAVALLEGDDLLLIKMNRIFDIMVERVIRGRTAFEN